VKTNIVHITQYKCFACSVSWCYCSSEQTCTAGLNLWTDKLTVSKHWNTAQQLKIRHVTKCKQFNEWIKQTSSLLA